MIRARIMMRMQQVGSARIGNTVARTIVKVLSVLDDAGGTIGQGPLCRKMSR